MSAKPIIQMNPYLLRRLLDGEACDVVIDWSLEGFDDNKESAKAWGKWDDHGNFNITIMAKPKLK